MLEHLNADEGIKGLFEFSWDIAVVHEVDSDAVLQTSCTNPLLSEGLLLDGQGECVDFTAIVLGRLKIKKPREDYFQIWQYHTHSSHKIHREHRPGNLLEPFPSYGFRLDNVKFRLVSSF